MKKIIALALVLITSAFVMIGCSKSGSGDDPFSIAKALDNGEREVEILVDQDDIADFGRALQISANGIYCIITIEEDHYDPVYNTERGGLFLFCDDSNAVERLYGDLENQLKYNYDIYSLADVKLHRKGTTLFLGTDAYFDEIYG